MGRTRSIKKESYEKLKFAFLVVAFIIVAMLTQAGNANAAELEDVNLRMFTVESPKGTTERFSSEAKHLSENISRRTFNKWGVSLTSNDSLCRGNANNDMATLDQLEIELELSNMITALNQLDGPKALTRTQASALKKVPPCQPYLADLKVIANILDGYKLVKVEYL